MNITDKRLWHPSKILLILNVTLLLLVILMGCIGMNMIDSQTTVTINQRESGSISFVIHTCLTVIKTYILSLRTGLLITAAILYRIKKIALSALVSCSVTGLFIIQLYHSIPSMIRRYEDGQTVSPSNFAGQVVLNPKLLVPTPESIPLGFKNGMKIDRHTDQSVKIVINCDTKGRQGTFIFKEDLRQPFKSATEAKRVVTKNFVFNGQPGDIYVFESSALPFENIELHWNDGGIDLEIDLESVNSGIYTPQTLIDILGTLRRPQ